MITRCLGAALIATVMTLGSPSPAESSRPHGLFNPDALIDQSQIVVRS